MMCECEKNQATITLAEGSFNVMWFIKDENGVKIMTCGEEGLEYNPVFCPLCGRKLK